MLTSGSHPPPKKTTPTPLSLPPNNHSASWRTRIIVSPGSRRMTGMPPPPVLVCGRWSIQRSNVPHCRKEEEGSDVSIAADPASTPWKERRGEERSCGMCVPDRQTDRDCGGDGGRTDRQTRSRSLRSSARKPRSAASRHVTFSPIRLGGLLLRSEAVGNMSFIRREPAVL